MYLTYVLRACLSQIRDLPPRFDERQLLWSPILWLDGAYDSSGWTTEVSFQHSDPQLSTYYLVTYNEAIEPRSYANRKELKSGPWEAEYMANVWGAHDQPVTIACVVPEGHTQSLRASHWLHLPQTQGTKQPQEHDFRFWRSSTIILINAFH